MNITEIRRDIAAAVMGFGMKLMPTKERDRLEHVIRTGSRTVGTYWEGEVWKGYSDKPKISYVPAPEWDTSKLDELLSRDRAEPKLVELSKRTHIIPAPTPEELADAEALRDRILFGSVTRDSAFGPIKNSTLKGGRP